MISNKCIYYNNKYNDIINEIANDLSIKRALKVIYLFNEYVKYKDYKKGDRFKYKDGLYEVLVDHISHSEIPDPNSELYKKCLW